MKNFDLNFIEQLVMNLSVFGLWVFVLFIFLCVLVGILFVLAYIVIKPAKAITGFVHHFLFGKYHIEIYELTEHNRVLHTELLRLNKENKRIRALREELRIILHKAKIDQAVLHVALSDFSKPVVCALVPPMESPCGKKVYRKSIRLSLKVGCLDLEQAKALSDGTDEVKEFLADACAKFVFGKVLNDIN